VASTSTPAPRRAVRRAPKRLLSVRADEYLVGRMRAGDDVAFEVLYERHAPSILSFCRHMLSDAEEAEDAVQQTFLSAHRDLLQDERQIRVKPWLYTIARNRCVSILRMRRDQTERDPVVATTGLGEEVQRRSDLRDLVADLRDLPDDQRAALVLTELGDLSHADVADVLDCRTANVKGLVFRARAGLMERREAREARCQEIREELASARYGTLRRGRLRHHLAACPGCRTYLEEVRRQRQMMALVLPVLPSLGLKRSVLAATGLGGGGGAAAGGGTLAGAGLSAAGLSTVAPGGGAIVAKVAVLGALAGSIGVAGQATLDRGSDMPDRAPAPSAPTSIGSATSGREPVAPDGPSAVRRFERKADKADARTRPAKGPERRRAKSLPEKARGHSKADGVAAPGGGLAGRRREPKAGVRQGGGGRPQIQRQRPDRSTPGLRDGTQRPSKEPPKLRAKPPRPPE
jgi:RNA polymerase sigma factor (sigma-70 family)